MSTHSFKSFFVVLLVVLVLAACVPAASVQDSQVKALQDQVTALESRVAALSDPAHVVPVTGVAKGNNFDLRVAQFVLDGAGFHGMATSISTNKKIEASYAGTVNRAHKVLAQTTWPDELAEQGNAFTVTLKDFGAALSANNLDDATKLSEQVHDAQHDLSHAIDDWFSKGDNAQAH